jgi:hypothetical protein
MAALMGPNYVITWDQLALATVVAARRGPTISSRLLALVNQALYDTWAAFDPKARGFTVDLHAQAFDLSGINASSELVAVAMAQAAAEVLRSVGASLFANQTLPPELASAIDAAKTVAMSTLPQARQQQVSSLAAAVEKALLRLRLSNGGSQQANYAETTGESLEPGLLTKILRDVEITRSDLEELLAKAERPANKPLEWTGHLQLLAAPPQAPCLPLRGSVGRTSWYGCRMSSRSADGKAQTNLRTTPDGHS